MTEEEKLLDLLRKYRYAYGRYEESSDQFDFDEMNNVQEQILKMFREKLTK